MLEALGWAIPALFTSGDDSVDFNNLTSGQQGAVLAGADIYHGLGGNDVVILPTAANFNESVGSSGSLGWTNTSASTFYTWSKPGQTYTVSGEDGNYYVSAGGGTDDITISGGGQSVIFAGSGTLSASIAGGGTLTVSGGFKGTEVASSGGTALGTTLSSSAVLHVFSGGVASGTTIHGGLQVVESGGTDVAARISGGEQDVFGYARGVTIARGRERHDRRVGRHGIGPAWRQDRCNHACGR